MPRRFGKKPRGPRPEKKSGPPTVSPLDAALRLLTTRDRSESEMATRLKQKGYEPAQIEQTLERCRELGFLDDARFAHNRVRALVNSTRAVGPRLRQQMHRFGLDKEVLEEAIREQTSEFDAPAACRELLERRFPQFCWESAEAKERQRVLGFALRRGFAYADVRAALNTPPDLGDE